MKTDLPPRRYALNARIASAVRSRSAFEWASLTNHASNCDGGIAIPRSRRWRWNFANFFVSQQAALSQFVTAPRVKNGVNIDPTRLTVTPRKEVARKPAFASRSA